MKILRITILSFLIMLTVALNAYSYFVMRREALRLELSELEHLVRIYAQDTTHAVEEIVAALEIAKYQYLEADKNREKIFEILNGVKAKIPYVRVIGLTDATGKVAHSSRGIVPPDVSLADRDYVAYFLDGGRERYFISGPAKNLVDGEWQFNVSVPIKTGTGKLIGVITAVVDPTLYSASVAEIAAPGDFVTLLYRDYRVMARVPKLESALGNSLRSAQIYRDLEASATGAASGEYSNVFTGEKRLGASRRILAGALAISTSRGLDIALADWRRTALIILSVSVAVLVLGIVLIEMVWRNLVAEQKTGRAVSSLNNQLMQETARAERLLHVKSEFLATMSHEIRTPMNGVLGMAQALQMMKLDDDIRDMVSVIKESAENLLGIINDILDFSRLEAGQMRVEIMSIQVRKLVKSLEDVFTPACRQKSLQLRIHVDDEVPEYIESDHIRLRQVLMNLIGNAVKFTDQGIVDVRVSLKMRDGASMLLFKIEDTGPGLPAAAIDSLFERFVQADASIARKFGGTGLGLAISKRLTELLEGRIGAENRAEGGARFWLELPCEPMGETEMPQLVKPNSAQVIRGMSVLFIDDNQVNRKAMQALLKPFGVALTLVDSGREAVELCRTRSFDVILLDIHMPEMDGFETLLQFRRLPQPPSCPIFAVTADVMPEAVAHYKSAGFNGVLAKPLMVDALVDTIAGNGTTF